MKEQTKAQYNGFTKFKPLEKDGEWAVATDPGDVVIAKIPTYIKHKSGVARALAQALSQSKFVLNDLI